MSKIIITLYLTMMVFLQAQTIKVESIKDNEFTFSILNDLKEDFLVEVHDDKPVFVEIELWDSDEGIRVMTAYRQKISDGFVALDYITIKPNESRIFKASFTDYRSETEYGQIFLKRFIERGKKHNYYNLRLIIKTLNHDISSKLHRVFESKTKPIK